jgi:DNA-binding GntR family transcriptional regulator
MAANVKSKASAASKSVSSLQSVYDYIKARILRLELPPGKNLAEIDFVKELKVSRTPVREALIKLASEGLVKLHQNRGAWVSEITLSDIRQFFEALDVSQRMVTRWAAMRCDPSSLESLHAEAARFEERVAQGDIDGMNEANYAFHAVIAANCGNALAQEHYLKLLNIGTRISYLALLYEKQYSDTSEFGGLEHIVEEHRQMLRYIVAGQADEAERIAKEHVLHFRQRVLGYLTSNDASAIKLTG